jgi:hypothetical protein
MRQPDVPRSLSVGRSLLINVSQAASEPDARRLQPRETAKILGDCRDLAIHRLVLSFSGLLDRVGDMLIERANKSIIRDETALYLAARRALQEERAEVMVEFERRLRQHVDTRISGDPATKADFSKVDATKLTLIDTSVMDESVITGNIRRNVENFCHDELLVLNRGMGHLLGRADLETDANPLAPGMIVEAFAGALRGVRAEERIKLAILRELNQSSLGELNAIYADINAHLINLRVVPPMIRVAGPGRGGAGRAAARKAGTSAESSGPEIDLMALFQQRYGSATAPSVQQGPPSVNPAAAYGPAPVNPAAGPIGSTVGGPMAGMPGAAAADQDAFNPFWMLGGPPPDSPPALGPAFELRAPAAAPEAPAGPLDVHYSSAHQAVRVPPFPPIDVGAGPRYVPGTAPPRTSAEGMRYLPTGPMVPTPSGYVPGTPIIATAELGESLTRLQAGETDFDLGGGTFVRFSGIPQGKHNVLRDLQESALGSRVNQLESMTIELVAMLFDFIFETRDLPDGIKALLARLQIPVLKAAMLDGAFFAKKSHPSRILVNALAQAGLGWAPAMGHDDPLYQKLHDIVHKILDNFTDDLSIFEVLRAELETFLAEEEKAAEANIQATAEEIHEHDLREIAPVVAKLQTERRIETYPVPNFLAVFLRQRWATALERIYLESGEESEAWDQAIATVEDLVWSVQPKKTREDRRHLVALLPSLLKRLTAGLREGAWPREERDGFMENLVEAHAAAVKPTLHSATLPTEAVAEQAKADAEQAKAAGDDAAAQKAEALAAAMSQAGPTPVDASGPAIIDDQFFEIAQSLERGMWIEFEDDDGQLAFAKLAWVSPLRGTYLFTNRQGQKALSMTAEQLAERFRGDRARLVEAEPLLDQAFTSMMASLGQSAEAKVE